MMDEKFSVPMMVTRRSRHATLLVVSFLTCQGAAHEVRVFDLYPGECK